MTPPPATTRSCRYVLLGTLASVLIAAPLIARGTGTRPYNSEEHQLIVDRGAAQVTIPPSVVLPAGVALVAVRPGAYADDVRRAKILAVGFGSNQGSDYSSRRGSVQDNCYWHNFRQSTYNKAIHVPDAPSDSVPGKVLRVPGYATAATLTSFTLGQLAALYGDYRRTTFCDAAGRCYLTNRDTPTLAFARGNVVNKGFYCPTSRPAGEYLQAIASGLVPPFGTIGNTVANTANDDEYGEAGWWGDEMLRIANVNDWHFSNAAIAWYVGLHRLALLYADSARTDSRHWIAALHHEANALHALTDLFAFGHVVTNRDETSYGIMKDHSLLDNPGYQWMEHVIRLGGGTRAGAGTVALSSDLPAIAAPSAMRNDFVKSYRGTWAWRADGERRYHDEFNTSGAQVRNLNGDDFNILGDGRLHQMSVTGTAVPVLTAAVRTSVQALFDAHETLATGAASVAQLGASGSSYFAALKYVPLYVAQDGNRYFLGRWVLYAKAVDEIAGAGRVPADWEACKIPYLSGRDSGWPPVQTEACAPFPAD